MEKLKIMLINPPRVQGFPVVREERFEHKDIGSVYPPLSLLYTAAILEKHSEYTIKLIDANGFDLSYNNVVSEIIEYCPDLVLIRTGFDTWQEDMKILAPAKAVGALTVMRNKIIGDVVWLKSEVLKNKNLDVFLNVEPEAIVENLAAVLVKSREEKKTEHTLAQKTDSRASNNFDFLKEVLGISFYSGTNQIDTTSPELNENFDEIPFPAYHLLPTLKVYHTGVLNAPFALVQTTRGCPFKCTFCAFGKSGYRTRSVENVITEIKYLKEKFKIKSFLFFDDTLSLKPGRAEEIAKRMIEEKLNDLEWVCCTRANLVTYDMLKIMKQAGMKEIAIGIETGSQKILDNIKKGVALDDIRNVSAWCHKLKILFYGLVIIGLPGETKETVAESVKFIKEIDPFYTQFCFSTPFPNTEIYEDYEKNGYLLTKDWTKYFPLSEEPTVRTEALSAEDLKALRNWAYKKLLFRPLYLLKKIRPFDWKWNITGAAKIIDRMLRVLLKKPVR